MAAMPAAIHDEVWCDAGLVEKEMCAGLSRGRNTSSSTYGKIWATFLQQFSLAPKFAPSKDPIPWLQIFSQRERNGQLSASGKLVGSSQVADALLFVAQAHTLLGLPNPRKLLGGGPLDPRLARQLRGYHKQDPSPKRVKPAVCAFKKSSLDLASA